MWFPNAIASTPLCCPSRATILTGQFDTRTHVRDNNGGPSLDDTNTLPVWLHRAGYTTALVGKYLNFYPWGRAPFVPAGWDRWFAKENANESTSYYDYDVVDGGYVRHYGAASSAYATDVLAAGAADAFVSGRRPTVPGSSTSRRTRRTRRGSRRTATATHRRAFPPDAVARPDERCAGEAGLRHVAPATLTGPQVEAFAPATISASGRCCDRWMTRSASLVDAVAARGELDRTAIVFLTDNGYEFGLHRLEGKRYPYEPSIGLPFAIRAPWSVARTDPTLVAERRSRLDDLRARAGAAGAPPGRHQPGAGAGWPAHRGTTGGLARLGWRRERAGVVRRRTAAYTYVRNADGTEELYRNADDPLQPGTWPPDPRERAVLDRLERLTDSLAVPEGGR